MPSTVDEYREAKMTYLRLRDQAKKDLLAQFHQLATQLFQIQRELREDFGHKVSIPTKPPAKRAKKSRGSVEAASKSSAPVLKSVRSSAPAPTTSPRIVAAEKKLASAQAKLAQLAAAGKPVQAVRDRIYELEDELRLARGE